MKLEENKLKFFLVSVRYFRNTVRSKIIWVKVSKYLVNCNNNNCLVGTTINHVIGEVLWQETLPILTAS